MAFWRRKHDDKFSTSILGLDKSIEELKEREAAVEREIGVRFSKAIEKTRDSINNRLDKVFEGRKQIDEQLLDELEEMLISTDIGVQTTMQVLEAIRTGVSRQEINDLVALKKRFVEAGVWVRPFGNIVYLTPALNMAAEDVDVLTDAIHTVLAS